MHGYIIMGSSLEPWSWPVSLSSDFIYIDKYMLKLIKLKFTVRNETSFEKFVYIIYHSHPHIRSQSDRAWLAKHAQSHNITFAIYAWVDTTTFFCIMLHCQLVVWGRCRNFNSSLSLSFISIGFQTHNFTQTDFYSRMSIVDSQHEAKAYLKEFKPQNQICVYTSFKFTKVTHLWESTLDVRTA